MIIDRRTKLIQEGKSQDYVNRGFRTLKAILNTADLSHSNPVSAIYKKYGLSLQSTGKRDNYLSTDQILKLFEDYDKHSLTKDSKNKNGLGFDASATIKNSLHDKELEKLRSTNNHLSPMKKPSHTKGNQADIYSAVIFILLTGSRKNEMYNLLWSDVDEIEHSIKLRETKNGTSFKLPLIGMLVDLLDRQPRLGPKVFGFTDSSYRTQFEKNIKEPYGFTTQTLRRTWAEHASYAGVDTGIISLALNHKDAGQNTMTTKHYLNHALSKLRTLQSVYMSYQSQLITYLMFKQMKPVDNNFVDTPKPPELLLRWKSFYEEPNKEKGAVLDNQL